MVTHGAAVAADVDDVTVVDERVDECGAMMSPPRISPQCSKPLILTQAPSWTSREMGRDDESATTFKNWGSCAGPR